MILSCIFLHRETLCLINLCQVCTRLVVLFIDKGDNASSNIFWFQTEFLYSQNDAGVHATEQGLHLTGVIADLCIYAVLL